MWTVGPPDLGTQGTLVIMFWSLNPRGHFCGVIVMSGQWSRCPERKVVNGGAASTARGRVPGRRRRREAVVGKSSDGTGS